MARTTRGGCLCGAVTYELAGELRPVVACHCNQCRKTSGHYVAATQVPSSRARITGDTRFTAWADLLRKDWQPRSTSLRSLVEDTEIFEAGPGLDEGWPAP